MKKNIFLILFIFYFTDCSLAETREGFVAGIGTGVAGIFFDKTFQRENSTIKRSDTDPGFVLDLILGYAVTDNLFMYFINREIWLNDQMGSGNKTAFVNSMGPLGISLYLNKTAPSIIFSAGAGFSHWYAPFERNQKLHYGQACFFGMGYEFRKNLSVQCEAMISNNNSEDNGLNIKTGTRAIIFSLRAMYY